jgi:hypothetical protein
MIRGKDFLGIGAYRFRCYFRTKGVDSIAKSISIKARWTNAQGQDVLGEYISSYAQEGTWYKAEQVLTAPIFAKSVGLELVLQWTATGTVWWDDVSFEEVSPSRHRKVKVAAVSYALPHRTRIVNSSPRKSRQLAKLEQISFASTSQ